MRILCQTYLVLFFLSKRSQQEWRTAHTAYGVRNKIIQLFCDGNSVLGRIKKKGGLESLQINLQHCGGGGEEEKSWGA